MEHARPPADDAWPQLVREALLYVEWARGGAGRWLPAEGPGRGPAARSAAGAEPGAGAPAVGPGLPGRSPPGAEGGPRRAAGAPLAGAARSAPPPAPPAAVQADSLPALAAEVAGCRRCRLCEGRTQTVFGAGVTTPRLVVVGEAPGAEEDRTGLPFVGAAGGLLTRMLAAIGLARERDVYILNVLKCRPPGNRPPSPEEVAACKPFLRAQLTLLGPPLLLALGNHATRALLATERGISSLRGRFTSTEEGWRVMPTFHPSYLLRNPAAKREVWDDLKKVAHELGLPPAGASA